MKEVAIILHLYYTDLWDEFKDKLQKLDVEYDLYVTIPIGEHFTRIRILESFPNANIMETPNRGLDIGPFLLVLKHLISAKKQYNYIVKLHTKKSIHHGQPVEFGRNWRTVLVDSLIGSPERLRNVVNYLEHNPQYKLAVAEEFLYEEPNTGWMQDLLSALGIDTKVMIGPKLFAAGSMFIVDYTVILDFFKQIEIDTLYELMQEGYARDGRIEHKMERVLSFIVLQRGFNIYRIQQKQNVSSNT